MRELIIGLIAALCLLIVAWRVRGLEDEIKALMLRVEYLEWDLLLRRTSETARIRREIEEESHD